MNSLTWASFDFGTEPTVTVEAAYSKRRRLDVQPLPDDLAAELKAWWDRRGDDADAVVFTLPPLGPNTVGFKTAEMLRADLDAAGIPYVDDNDEYLDFHALRHSYVTWLVDNDVSPKLAQRLARHASITLTMDRYYKPSIANERAALKKLPSVTKKPTDGDASEGAA